MILSAALLILATVGVAEGDSPVVFGSGAYSGTGGARDACSNLLQALFPFGPSSGDTSASPGCDDCAYGPMISPLSHVNVSVPVSFKFLGSSYSSVFMGTNGLLSLGTPVELIDPLSYPYLNVSVIAAWWVDVDTRGADAPAVLGAPAPNTLYRRLTAAPSAAEAARVSADVQASFPGEPPFVPTLLGVFTWFAVGRYNARVDALDTFQVALAADAGSGRTFVTLCYDNLVGTSGSVAASGFYSGSNAFFYSITLSLATVSPLSCGGSRGCYTFRVDAGVVAPAATPTPSPSPTASSSASPPPSPSRSTSASVSRTPTPSSPYWPRRALTTLTRAVRKIPADASLAADAHLFGYECEVNCITAVPAESSAIYRAYVCLRSGTVLGISRYGDTVFRVAGPGYVPEPWWVGCGSDIGDGGAATAACISSPSDVAVGPTAESFFIAENMEHRIRLVKLGIIETAVASTTPCSVWLAAYDGMLAMNACLSSPTSLAIHPYEGLLIADSALGVILKLKGGRVWLFAGPSRLQGSSIWYFHPRGGWEFPFFGPIAVHPHTLDVLVVAGTAVLAFSSRTGNVSTILNGSNWTDLRTVSNASLAGHPAGGQTPYTFVLSALAVDPQSGDAYVGASGFYDPFGGSFFAGGVLRIGSNFSSVEVVAGQPHTLGQTCYTRTGSPLDMCLTRVAALDVEQNTGALLIAEFSVFSTYTQVFSVSVLHASVEVVLGEGPLSASGDGGPFTAAYVAYPADIVVLTSGDIAFVDPSANRVRVVDAATGVVSTVAGMSGRVCNQPTIIDGLHATHVCFSDLRSGLAAHPITGDLIFSSAAGGLVAINMTSGLASVVAGTVNSTGLVTTRFAHPVSVITLAYDPVSLVLYCFDQRNAVVFAIEDGVGQPSIIAAGLECFGSLQNCSACFEIGCASTFSAQRGNLLALTTQLLVADRNFGVGVIWSLDIRSPKSAKIKAFAGSYHCYYGSMNGHGVLAVDACLVYPRNLARSPAGDVFFYDNGIVRFVTPAGVIFNLGILGIGADGRGGLSDRGGFALDRMGNIIATVGILEIEIGVVLLSYRVSCPVGHACPDGRPMPCNSTTYCPPNSLRPLAPTARFALSNPVVMPSGKITFGAQEVCPVGSYCVGAAKVPCPAGTLGQFGGAYSPENCVPCRPGTYSALSGQTAMGCRPCPTGASLPLNSSGASQCSWCAAGRSPAAAWCNEACPPGSYSMGGPTGCSPLPTGLSALAWDNFFSLVALQTGSSGSIAASASHYFTTALLYSPMATAAVVVVVASACLLCAVGLVRRQKRSLGFLRVFDMFDLQNPVREGHSPVKHKTRFGGAFSVLAIFFSSAIAAVLIYNFVDSSAVPSMPVFVPVSPVYVSLPTAASNSARVSGGSLASGLRVGVFAHGQLCGSLHSWRAFNLLSDGGSFTNSSSFDNATGTAEHVFDCPSCALLAVSLLDVHLHASCQVRGSGLLCGLFLLESALAVQSLLVLGWAVGADGTVTAASVIFQQTLGAPPASAVAVSFGITLQILSVHSSTDATHSVRGFQISPTEAVTPVNSDAASILVRIYLPLSPYYQDTQVVPAQTPVQLLSSLVGLLGLVSLFGRVKYLVQMFRGVLSGPRKFQRLGRQLMHISRRQLPPSPKANFGAPGGSGEDQRVAQAAEELSNWGGVTAASVSAAEGAHLVVDLDDGTHNVAGPVTLAASGSAAEGAHPSLVDLDVPRRDLPVPVPVATSGSVPLEVQ